MPRKWFASPLTSDRPTLTNPSVQIPPERMTPRWLLAALAGFSCAPQPNQAESGGIVVLAASSLTESLQQTATKWTAAGNPKVTFSFDASSRLAKQIEAGSPADLYFSADTDWMDYLDSKGLIDPSTRANLVGNTLVAIVQRDSTLHVKTVADLSQVEIRHLGLAGENVPAGRYARQALMSVAVLDALKPRIVSGESVRTVLSWTANGETEAAVVYATDARVESKVKVAFTFPTGSHPPIVYPVAVLTGTTNATAAGDFLAFCKGPEGLAIFTTAGFTALP